MGMAASQVRFLSLQNRRNTIGKQLSALSNRKMSLSRDMNDVSRHYTEALNKINLKWSNDCGKTYYGLSYDMLMKPNDVNTGTPYIITNARNGKVILNDMPLLDQNGDTIKNKQMTFTYSDGTPPLVVPEGSVTYMSIARVLTGGCTTDANNIVIGGEPNKIGEYYIPNDGDFGFENNLRFQLFQMLGLVNDHQVQQKNNLLVQLYGSQEAKETGKYPVGSAWGDYYIAKAKLDAYEAYLETDDYFLGSNTFLNSQGPEETRTNTDGDYTYNSTVNMSGSQCIQKGGTNNANYNKIDFNTRLTTNNDGVVTTTTNHKALSTTFDDSNNPFGQSFVSKVTSSGIDFEYSASTDILSNAIANYKAEKPNSDITNTLTFNFIKDEKGNDREYTSVDSTNHDFSAWIYGENDILMNQVTNSYSLIHALTTTSKDRVIVTPIIEDISRDWTLESGQMEDWEVNAVLVVLGTSYINQLCDDFDQLLGYSDIELSADALKAAKNALTSSVTKMVNKGVEMVFNEDNVSTGYQTLKERLKTNSYGVTGAVIGYNLQGNGNDIAALGIDVQEMFNIYLSYINDYMYNGKIATSINKGSSHTDVNYYISTSGKPIKNDAYLTELQGAVDKAAKNIQTLEDNIELFYSNADQKIMDYYDALFLRISEQGWEVDNHTKNDNYLNNKIQNNDFFLTECLQKNATSGFRYTAKQATSISKIFSVHDTNAEQEALVKYETEKNMLQAKEHAIDSRMRILETEEQAIKTEMDSIEKVKNDNISKYFKIFA